MENHGKLSKTMESNRKRQKTNHFLVAKELEDQRLWEDPGVRQMSASHVRLSIQVKDTSISRS
jgi:hypothetical protein